MDLHSAPEFDPRWTAASENAASPHEVCRPFGASGNGKRPTPDLPHPAVLRLQAFSASWRFVPPETVPALFHAGGTLGVLPSEVCSSRAADTASQQVFPSWRCPTQFAEANPKPCWQVAPPTWLRIRVANHAGHQTSWRLACPDPQWQSTGHGWTSIATHLIESVLVVARACAPVTGPIRSLTASGQARSACPVLRRLQPFRRPLFRTDRPGLSSQGDQTALLGVASMPNVGAVPPSRRRTGATRNRRTLARQPN